MLRVKLESEAGCVLSGKRGVTRTIIMEGICILSSA